MLWICHPVKRRMLTQLHWLPVWTAVVRSLASPAYRLMRQRQRVSRCHVFRLAPSSDHGAYVTTANVGTGHTSDLSVPCADAAQGRCYRQSHLVRRLAVDAKLTVIACGLTCMHMLSIALRPAQNRGLPALLLWHGVGRGLQTELLEIHEGAAVVKVSGARVLFAGATQIALLKLESYGMKAQQYRHKLPGGGPRLPSQRPSKHRGVDPMAYYLGTSMHRPAPVVWMPCQLPLLQSMNTRSVAAVMAVDGCRRRYGSGSGVPAERVVNNPRPVMILCGQVTGCQIAAKPLHQ